MNIPEPYQWYIALGAIAIIVGLISRLVFKTIKWFLLLFSLVLIALAVIKILAA